MFIKYKKIINFSVILPFLSIIIFEFIVRVIIFTITLNINIFAYGLNDNISLALHSLKKREIYISNDTVNLKNIKKNKFNNNDEMWIFGGSTSNKGFCDSKNLSWVDLLETDLVKKNYSKNGVNSSFSLKVMRHEFEKNISPKTIIWANKVNETLHSKRSNDFNNKFLYLANSIKLSLKKTFVLFYFTDELILRVFDKLNINIRNEKKQLDMEDYIYSAKKYYVNTEKAISLSKLYKVENFYIVSLFNKSNLENNESNFYKFYKSKVDKIIEKNKFVKFIDTKDYLNSYDKKNSLFCDSMHQNYKGKIITANIISKEINDYK